MLWVILLIIVVILLSITALTVIWLCFRAITPEGENPPKWGELRPLKRLFQRRFFIFRMAAAVVLAGLMTIPISFIKDLVDERYVRGSEVISEISGLWGGVQTFAGPVISVPFTVRSAESEQIPLTEAELSIERSRGGDRVSREVIRTVESLHEALVLPEYLAIEGKVSTEMRSRGIYSTRVYTAELAVSGNFLKPDLSGLSPHITDIHWDKAVAAVGISGTRAIRDISGLEIAGQTLKFLPGSSGNDALPTGFSSQCDLSSIPDGEPVPFEFRVSVGGANSLFLTPVGTFSRFRIESEWPHPNFTGAGLPTSRDISPEGFAAVWEIPNLVRNYPQVSGMESWAERSVSDYDWDYGVRDLARGNGGYYLGEYVAGVEFFEPVFHYSLLLRSTKYAALFILMTFLALAILENFLVERSEVRLNMVQYGVIGLGLALFYLTLLAVSEHLGFGRAYLLSAAINVAMTGGYVLGALKLRKPAALTALVQGLLYALLFFILRMEDYALLAGSVLLLLATASLMFTTRNINHPQKPGPTDAPDATLDMEF
ncbi:MAG: cell envelope integrity protein CreD [Synergistaceae bacterium]|nr:cell envelope integrity protein CreD [Synergistaceae bacterium]